MSFVSFQFLCFRIRSFNTVPEPEIKKIQPALHMEICQHRRFTGAASELAHALRSSRLS